ncbi:MAG: hypothetical protein EB127_11200 [Alphaproteobacteria bacterium]|nr:hypothetical protein [Alphaproteobacteria bacterium]
MKATLEFNLPEDKYEWENAVNANQMMRALWDINDELRKLWKYGELNDQQFEMVEQIREKFNEIINENQIQL